MNRREAIKSVVSAVGLLASSRLLRAQSPAARDLGGNISVIDAGGANVVAFDAGSSLVLVDSGTPGSGEALLSALGGQPVETLFNTHYHLDQTGNNEHFGKAGAKMIAHERTQQWMSTRYYLPGEDRYQEARPQAARPTETFLDKGSLTAGSEQIGYGYLTLAHTSGDIYVHFRNSDVLVVGDVASPLRDPALDWFTGAWIGGRVDAMDELLKLASESTQIVPAYGPVISRAELQAERDMMENIRGQVWELVRQGDGPMDMLEAGVMEALGRTWDDPYQFLYDTAKGLWAHHNKLDHNVV